MYRVMIVDDEPAIRKGLTNFMPWDALDCKVSAIACDGIEALELLKTTMVDIVVTDIKMPGMDGIELSGHIYRDYPAIKTIILTAYGDFNYSQSAIRYGAVDFVLKPTSTDKFVEAIDRAKALIRKEREKNAVIDSLRSDLTHQLEDLLENFLVKVLHGVEDVSQIPYKSQINKIELRHFIAIVAEITDPASHRSQQTSPNHGIQIVKRLMSSIFKEYPHYTVIVDEDHVCSFLNIGKDGNPSTESVLHSCHELSYITKNLNKSALSLGISKAHYGIQYLSEAYKEGLYALSDSFYTGSAVNLYDPGRKYPENSYSHLIEDYVSQITKLIQGGRYTEVLETLRKIFLLQTDMKQTIDHTKNLSILIYSLLIGLLPKSEDPSANIIRSRENVCSQIWSSRSIFEVYQILESTLQHLVSSPITEKESSSIIEKIDQYIMNHYHENIGLQSIANHVHLNSSYLSRLYKKETNITLTEKITHARMEKAKILLMTTSLKVYEVASIVGFENPTYFSILFKKYTGHYPKGFRDLFQK